MVTEARRESSRKYYAAHREKILEKSKRYHAAHRDKRLAQCREYDRKKKLAVVAAYGGKCTCCGELQLEFLSIDHINGDGSAHRKSIGGSTGRHLYKWLQDRGYPKDNFQLLCMNCNFAKGHYAACPHEEIPCPV